ncbi:hypothetical protein RZS08_26915, partial [Arthrospira platensis SPKY1]|nr:hypothetical protein [Arthrospira platensis SPKY1]
GRRSPHWIHHSYLHINECLRAQYAKLPTSPIGCYRHILSRYRHGFPAGRHAARGQDPGPAKAGRSQRRREQAPSARQGSADGNGIDSAMITALTSSRANQGAPQPLRRRVVQGLAGRIRQCSVRLRHGGAGTRGLG